MDENNTTTNTKMQQRENETSSLSPNLFSQPPGRQLHLLLQHKGRQHVNDAEDRPPAAKKRLCCTSSNARAKNHSQGCSVHAAAWLKRGGELKIAAFVAAMKGGLQNNSGSVNVLFCSKSRRSGRWQMCSVWAATASGCHRRWHGGNSAFAVAVHLLSLWL